MKKRVPLVATLALVAIAMLLPKAQTLVLAEDDGDHQANCQGLPTASQLKALLIAAANPANGGIVGGLFEGTRMWGAIVNRDGQICTYTTSTADRTQVWPGSQAIAKAKA